MILNPLILLIYTQNVFLKIISIATNDTRLCKIYIHKFGGYFCFTSFFFQKLFNDLFIISSHSICKQVDAVLFLIIIAGKIFFLVYIKKPLPHKILIYHTNTIINMELLIYNPGHNILKLYSILVQIQFITSKRKLDI